LASVTTSSRRGLGRLGPAAVVIGCTIFFVFPLLAMARFALQSVPMVLLGWSTLFDKWSLSGVTQAFSDQQFRDALSLSFRLALGTVALTLALLLPTTLWVHLRLPRARPLVEFLTVLPYVIPPIALVAGIVPLQPHARWFLNSDFSLVPFYTVLALPFTFRSLDAGVRAIDVKTLTDASRSLGAGWGRTLTRALIPNLRTAIVSSAFLTAAVVLGEFTIASVLLKRTLPQFTESYQQREPQGGMAVALLMILATTALFAVLTVVTRKRGMARAATIY
jgi:putative spermidine/putrescine transport system permease protein